MLSSLRSIHEHARRLAGFVKAVTRSYPPSWAKVVEDWGLNGRDRLRLREIVQYRGTADLDPHAPASSWPARTPDLARRLRDDPDDTEARETLARRGYDLEGDRLRRLHDGRVRTAYLINETAQDLYDYLYPIYEANTRHPAANPARIQRAIVALLEPYYPDVTPNRVRGALDNHDAVKARRG